MFSGQANETTEANEANTETPKEKELMNKIEERQDENGRFSHYVMRDTIKSNGKEEYIKQKVFKSKTKLEDFEEFKKR